MKSDSCGSGSTALAPTYAVDLSFYQRNKSLLRSGSGAHQWREQNVP